MFEARVVLQFDLGDGQTVAGVRYQDLQGCSSLSPPHERNNEPGRADLRVPPAT